MIKTLFIFIFSLNALSAELLFEENFDNQPNWHPSAKLVNSDSSTFSGVLPENWDFFYNNEFWTPDDGFADSHYSIEISGEDSNKFFGETGKSFIKYNESSLSQSNNFASDGMITKDIPPSDKVYVEFMIKFQQGFADDYPPPPEVDPQFLIKIMRVLHYDGNGSRTKFFSIGDSAPIYIYDWGTNEYGVRNSHSIRCDSQETNYRCSNPAIINDYPRAATGGSMSANYTSDIFKYNSSLKLIDQIEGFLPNSGIVSHDQVFGNSWHKIGVYLQLNSSPGAQDGILRQWFDENLIVELKQIPWIGNDGDMNAKWNSISFGGNAHFHFDLNASSPKSNRERWYAIDDIKVFNDFPTASELRTNINNICFYYLLM